MRHNNGKDSEDEYSDDCDQAASAQVDPPTEHVQQPIDIQDDQPRLNSDPDSSSADALER